MWKVAAAWALAIAVSNGQPALAQSKAPAAASRSAASIECSRQADEKGLHGKARKHFRSKCIRQAKKVAQGLHTEHRSHAIR
jgi:psiF repeat